jgi:hypothetical protein
VDDGGSRGGKDPSREPSSAITQFPPPIADVSKAAMWLSFDTSNLSYEGFRQFRDAAGHSFLGKVQTEAGGTVEVDEGPAGRGDAIRFPPPCKPGARCARAMVVVADAKVLDPGDADFSYGATIKLEANETTTGSNVLQKGRFGTDGGQWKLQVDNIDGKPSCVVRGDGDLLRVRSWLSLADGDWHRVRCSKDRSGVEIDVDGTTRRTPGDVGTVSNDFEVRVGSAGLNAGDDQFHGALDDVFVTIEPSAS